MTDKINFRHNNFIYTSEKEGYYYAQPVGGIKKRIAKKDFNEAYDAYISTQVSDAEWQAQADAEKAQQIKAKKARDSKLPEGYRIESSWDGDCYCYHLYFGETKIASDWTAEPLYKEAQKHASEVAKDAQEQKTDEKPQETEKAKKSNKKASRKSKDIALTADLGDRKVTLTAKQVDFIKHIPDTCFYEHGLDSILYCDVLADEIGGQFAGKPMTVGAMISTLREKGLLEIGTTKVNGRKCKTMAFTKDGAVVASGLGLN